MKANPNIRMVDVGDKAVTSRQAIARGKIVMKKATFAALKEAKLPKGDALAAARLAGIMGAKDTPHLIPMCHPLLIDEITIDYSLDNKNATVEIEAMVKGSGKTGYEMEALTAISICALTIYDMCKAIDTSMRIQDIRLAKKSGGKSGMVVLE